MLQQQSLAADTQRGAAINAASGPSARKHSLTPLAADEFLRRLTTASGYDAATSGLRDAERINRRIAETALCADHNEKLVHFCNTCRVPCCCVCVAISHTAGHATESLAIAVLPYRRHTLEVEGRVDRLTTSLGEMTAEAAGWAKQLHAYVDGEVNVIAEAVAEKRAILHNDILRRAAAAKRIMDDEDAQCRAELASLDDGIATLEALIAGEGTVEGPLKGILYGQMSYQQFKTMASPVLHEPPKMINTLQLQLPVSNLMDVCDMMRWMDDGSASELLYPPREVFDQAAAEAAD